MALPEQCPECGGKRAHQTHCSLIPPVVPLTLEERLKKAALAIDDAASYWLAAIEREHEARKAADDPTIDEAYSLIWEFCRRADMAAKGSRPSVILTPPQM